MRNEIIFVMDSVGWQEFQDAKTPNLDKFNPVKAYSFAIYTCPSVHAMMRGSIPVPVTAKGKYRAYSEYVKTEHAIIPLSLATRGYTTVLVSNNLLVRDSWSGFDNEVITNESGKFDIEIVDFNKRVNASELVSKALKYIKPPYYMFMMFAETHTPYMDKDNSRKTHLESIEYLDKVFGELYEKVPKNTRIIVTADHSDCWHEGKLYGHNPKRYLRFIKNGLLKKLLEVFHVEAFK
jgi:hypothetical protein